MGLAAVDLERSDRDCSTSALYIFSRSVTAIISTDHVYGAISRLTFRIFLPYTILSFRQLALQDLDLLRIRLTLSRILRPAKYSSSRRQRRLFQALLQCLYFGLELIIQCRQTRNDIRLSYYRTSVTTLIKLEHNTHPSTVHS
jgi:hypothetical protein